MTEIARNPQERIRADTFADHMKRSVRAVAGSKDPREKIRIFRDFLADFNAGAFDECEDHG